MKVLKYALWGLLIVLVVLIVYKKIECGNKGKKSGKHYMCPLFSSEPTWMIPQQTYTTMREGKCYEVTDYGDRMNFRRVDLEQCGEKAPTMKSESLAEFSYIEE